MVGHSLNTSVISAKDLNVFNSFVWSSNGVYGGVWIVRDPGYELIARHPVQWPEVFNRAVRNLTV